MKKTILSIAVIAAAIFAASCQKENLQENIAPEGSASVFTATIESGASTKTTVERIDGTPATYKTKWENGDQISINGVTYTATPDGTDATKATFAKDPDTQTDPTGTFKAYFPADMYSDSKATLPETYDYEDGKYNMPMYAESSTTSFSFKNLCGVLAIKVFGKDFTSVTSIEVSSDKQMNGEFTATADGVLTFASKETLTAADKKVTLKFASAKPIASEGSATFYIPVPAGTHNPLAIKVTSGSTSKLMVTKKSGGVAVVRNTVYPIAFNGQPITGTAKRKGDIDVNWVQLWKDGPKFAEDNVFVSSDPDIGNTMTFADATLTGEDYVWGANWCTPSQDQMDELLKAATSDGSKKVKCEYTQENSVWGFKFTGLTDGYTSNSVFFPAMGGDSLIGGARYWSATAADGSKGLYMDLYCGNYGSDWNSKWKSLFSKAYVRPVLKN